MQKFKKYLWRSNIWMVGHHTETGEPNDILFSVKHLFGEANIAYEFSFAYGRLRILWVDERSIHVQFLKLCLIINEFPSIFWS